MLRALSAIYGRQLAVVVLTGMGQDGMEGAKEVVVSNGGSVIAQDEASCVVYGMPKAVVENQLCRAVLPLPEMGRYLIQQIDGRVDHAAPKNSSSCPTMLKQRSSLTPDGRQGVSDRKPPAADCAQPGHGRYFAGHLSCCAPGRRKSCWWKSPRR